MSYDINFWKPKPAASPTEPHAIYGRLGGETRLDELEDLPVDTILTRLKAAFPAYDPSEEFPLVELPEGSIEISHGPQHFRFDFRGPETGAEKARVWEILNGEFGCVCYDPQTDKLHTADDPPGYRPLTPDEVKQVEAMFGGRDIASMVRHMQRQQARRARLGCAVILTVALLLFAGVAALIVLALR
jgi:hypothetical protein